MDHNAPVGRRILGLLEDERRIGLVHADFDRGGLLPSDFLEGALSGGYEAGCADDEVSCEAPSRAANVLEPHARGAGVVGGGNQLGDARAGSDFWRWSVTAPRPIEVANFRSKS